MSWPLRRILKYGALGSLVLGSGISLHGNDYRCDSIALVRLARAGCAVVDIGLTYKRGLYFKEWPDKSCEEYSRLKSECHVIAADRLLKLICTNKGVYIKVGQHIGALEYLLPTEYVKTMKILHSNAPQNHVNDLYKVIRQDLKVQPEEIFDSFSDKPIGTASLAQVHKATLKDGTVVAVKVQHPYVRGNSIVDMKTMEVAVNLLAWVFPDFNMQWLVEESKKNLPIELDFLHEGRNAEKVAGLFKHFKWLKVPKIYWQHSSDRVLVMEYVEGGQVDDRQYMQANKIDPMEISNKLGLLYSNMIFTHGFVHSDPHPGNILVKKRDGQVDIMLLDHGLYSNLSRKFRYDYSQLWLSILQRDKDKMRHFSMELGLPKTLYGVFACMVTGRPWVSIMAGVQKTNIDEKEKNTIQNESRMIIPQISDVLAKVDRQMLLILKTNDLIRGIENTLGAQNRKTAFWAMSKCCVSAVSEEKRSRTANQWERFRLTSREVWALFKLNAYYLYQGLVNLNFWSSLRMLTG